MGGKQKVGRSPPGGSCQELVLRRLVLRILRLPILRSLLPAAIAGKPTTLIQELQPLR